MQNQQRFTVQHSQYFEQGQQFHFAATSTTSSQHCQDSDETDALFLLASCGGPEGGGEGMAEDELAPGDTEYAISAVPVGAQHRANVRLSGRRKQASEPLLMDESPPFAPLVLEDEKEVKRQRRLVKNREAAHLSRMRKKAYVEDLEKKLQVLEAENQAMVDREHENKVLHDEITRLHQENISLKSQVYNYERRMHHIHTYDAPAKPPPPPRTAPAPLPPECPTKTTSAGGTTKIEFSASLTSRHVKSGGATSLPNSSGSGIGALGGQYGQRPMHHTMKTTTTTTTFMFSNPSPSAPAHQTANAVAQPAEVAPSSQRAPPTAPQQLHTASQQ